MLLRGRFGGLPSGPLVIGGEWFRRDDWWFDCVLGELPDSLGCVPDLDVPDPMVLGPTLRLRPYILPTRGAG